MTVAYHRKPVLWDVDFDAPEGKLIGIIGPNGAGKSTLIKAVLGLIPKASGRVLIYGKPYRHQRNLVGYVPQRETVDWDFPVSARDVVAMGTYGRIGWFKPVTKTYKNKAMQALARVGSGLCPPSNQPTVWWPATACVSGPRLSTRCQDVLHGRAVCRRRCCHRKGHRHTSPRLTKPG